ncbi:MAG: phosphate ABC transporter substrate-binding protein [Bacillota bacterium]
MRLRLLLLLLSVALAACARSPAAVRIAGSTSVQPLAEVLAEAYARQGGERVTIQGGGSTAGLQALRNGVATLAAVSRRLSAEESAQGLVPHIIGYDVLTVLVHPGNPVERLTLAQLRQLFAGEVTDWSDLGGRPGRVHLISREAGSGSREAFRELVGPVSPRAIIQNSSGAIRVAVMSDPQAIGYVSLGAARLGGVRPLIIDGKAPGQVGYPLLRPLILVTAGPPRGEEAAFLRFTLGPAGQRLVQEEGILPARPPQKEAPKERE